MSKFTFITGALVVLGLSSAIAQACTGRCYLPGCPDTKFDVCHLDPEGTAQVHFKWKDHDEAWIQKKGDTSEPASAYGVQVFPCEPKTWADVQSCSDICGFCL